MPSIDVTAEVSHLLVAGRSSLLNAAAPLNMFFMFVTAFVSQVLMSWSNNMAPWNMPSMVVTADTSHAGDVPAISLLNASAPLNMFFMFFTAFVSQVLSSWLNTLAPWNMPSMYVTAIVTHLDVPGVSSWLNATAPLNMFFMFFTAVVSQVLMSWSNDMSPWNMPSMSVTLVI